jgi:hypothetical protein
VQLYIVASNISKGMTDDPRYNHGGPGHISMPKNSCGGVLKYDLDDSYTATNAAVSHEPTEAAEDCSAIQVFVLD